MSPTRIPLPGMMLLLFVITPVLHLHFFLLFFTILIQCGQPAPSRFFFAVFTRGMPALAIPLFSLLFLPATLLPFPPSMCGRSQIGAEGEKLRLEQRHTHDQVRSTRYGLVIHSCRGCTIVTRQRRGILCLNVGDDEPLQCTNALGGQPLFRGISKEVQLEHRPTTISYCPFMRVHRMLTSKTIIPYLPLCVRLIGKERLGGRRLQAA
mmetsp:Transcript_18988/g.48432  ORF Transcript_18988/g.48432 Transcript_18988/m.48432 type:complete len:208 (-) Transcript_18988:2044-2667(-)